jgi:flagellar hook assembly protein FlgD
VLHQNAPNPSAGATTVRYEVARTSAVSIKIYNTQGQHVKTLVEGPVEPGRYIARWDGRNLAGESVSSGVYFYKMAAPGFAATRKMLVVR